MRKGFEKLKNVRDNLTSSRSVAKLDKKSDDILEAEKKVEQYERVIHSLNKKISSNVGAGQLQDDEKRKKKIPEYVLSQLMEDSATNLPLDERGHLLKDVLYECSRLEKSISEKIINYEKNIENEVCKNLNMVHEQHILGIQKQKSIVRKCVQDSASARQKFETSVRLNDAKSTQLKEDLEEFELKLEKERDTYASLMFDLMAEEETISNHFMNYVKCQQLYYKEALDDIDEVLKRMNPSLSTNKKVFKVPLDDHLNNTNRSIAYVIELCVCCLVEKGLYEEGLMRVGCASSKLKRLKSAVDANLVLPPISNEYMDVHVLAGLLKLYLRSLPDPLLTFTCYDEFINAAKIQLDSHRKQAILIIIRKLPKHNYNNLRYLIKFLSYLSKKSDRNKMSSQNIAIVMSPNLLWPPGSEDNNYAMQVNSTASVNVIVEALIADWEYFFSNDSRDTTSNGGDTHNFYVSMTRDILFPDNGGFPHDKEQAVPNHPNLAPFMGLDSINNRNSTMTKSMHTEERIGNPLYKTHSRSNSHDASRILLDDDFNNLNKRSQSNSSLSDHSSPQQGSSPKLPVRSRRRYNKPAAPIPPDTPNAHHSNHLNNSKLSNTDDDEASVPITLNKAYKNKIASSCDDLSKPDKPPRPQPINPDTVNRSLRKTNLQLQHSVPLTGSSGGGGAVAGSSSSNNTGGGGDDSHHHFQQPPASKPGGGLPMKPVALPRKLVPNNNDDVVMMREKNPNEKPAIPERPPTLMRPPSFKGSLSDMSKSNYNSDNNINISNYTDSTSTPTLKKTNSFRNQSNNSASANCGLTQLERTQIYNIDKQQVSIIDVLGEREHNNHQQHLNQNNKNDKQQQLQSIAPTTTTNTNVSKALFSLHDDDIELIDNDVDDEYGNEDNNVDTNNSLAYDNSLHQHVPPSPRGFDSKIKRPQVPAPPPPITANSAGIRPKSMDEKKKHGICDRKPLVGALTLS